MEDSRITDERNRIEQNMLLKIMGEPDAKEQRKLDRELNKWIHDGRPIIIKGK